MGAYRKAGHLAGAELPPGAERRFLALWQSACELRNPLIHHKIATIEEVHRMVVLLAEMAGLDAPGALSALRSRLAPPAPVAAPSRPTPAPRWRVEVALPEGARATIPEDSGLAWAVAPGPAQPTVTACLAFLVDGDDAAIEVGGVPLRLSRSNVDAMLMSLAVPLRCLEASPEVGLHLERRRALQREGKATERSPARRRRRRAVSDATETARKRPEAAVGAWPRPSGAGVRSRRPARRTGRSSRSPTPSPTSMRPWPRRSRAGHRRSGPRSPWRASSIRGRWKHRSRRVTPTPPRPSENASSKVSEERTRKPSRARGDGLVLEELRWPFGATRALRTGDTATLRHYLFCFLARDPVFVDRWTKRLKRTLLARLPPEKEVEVSAGLTAAARSTRDDMNASTQALLALVTSAFAKATAPR